jgi:hypothetical protein
MTDLMDKVRIGLLIIALAEFTIAGFGATGELRSSEMNTPEDPRGIKKTFCRYCGMQGSSTRYCAGCGQRRQISSSIFHQCVHCGGNISDDRAFCTSCSRKF